MSKTNFFSQINHYLEGKNINLSISLKNDRLTCSVIFRQLDGSEGEAGPVIISGSADELDEGFIQALSKPVEKADKILGLTIDDSKMDEEPKEIKKKIEKPAKPLTGKAKEGYEKAKKYFIDNNFDNAEVQLKGSCKEFLSHPDVAKLMSDILSAQQDSEDSDEESKGQEDLFESAEAEETVETVIEKPIQELQKEVVAKGAVQPKVEPIPEPAIEEIQQPGMFDEQEEVIPEVKPMKPAENEENFAGMGIVKTIEPAPVVGNDLSSLQGKTAIDLLSIITTAKNEKNYDYGIEVCNLLLSKNPSHFVGKMKKQELENLKSLS